MTWEVYNAAKDLLNGADAAGALRLLTSHAEDDSPAGSAMAVLRAECEAALGRHGEAIATLEAAAMVDGKNFWVFYNLAVQYRITGQRDKALEATRKAHGCVGWPESQRNGYVFTHDFFSANIPDWQTWFTTLITAAPIECLEIGSWQGGSATWLLDKVVAPRGGSLTCIDTFEGSSEHAEWLGQIGGSLESLFDANIARTGHGGLCRKLVGRSQDVARRLSGERYDFIYIDGAHEAKFVIQDALLCWPVLRRGGHMLFDDTHFTFDANPEQNSQTAIAAFLSWFAEEIDVLTPRDARQLLLRKRPG